MGRYIVGYEGRDTLDGRLIELDALEPNTERIPIVFDFRYYEPDCQMGWAEDFQRRATPEGWNEISFELYFTNDWEDEVRDRKLTPTCAMSAPISRTPYDNPEKMEKTIISEAKITAVGFSDNPNAWGEHSK